MIIYATAKYDNFLIKVTFKHIFRNNIYILWTRGPRVSLAVKMFVVANLTIVANQIKPNNIAVSWELT